MRGKLIGLCGAAAAIFCSTPNLMAYEFESDPYVKLGVGVTISEDYGEMLEENGKDDDWGWIDVSAGVEFPLSERFALIPGVGCFFSYPEDDLNFLLVPQLALKIYFGNEGSLTDIWYPDATYDTYLQFEANYTIPYFGSDSVDVDAGDGGFGGAVLIGCQLPHDFDIGLGASYLPVDDKIEESRNMGGFIVRLSKVIW